MLDITYPILPVYLGTATVGLSLACIVTLWAPWLSNLVPALTTYGKATVDLKYSSWLVQWIAVPKRWFSHFYLLAVLWTGRWLMVYYDIYYYQKQSTEEEMHVMSKLTGVKPRLDFVTSAVALSLIFLHVFRRCYETLFVSVYSDSSMNLGHYLMGVLHYIVLPIAVVCETIGVANKASVPVFSLVNLNFVQYAGIVLFFYCNYHQHQVVQQMANLRKGPKGNMTINYFHGVCHGGWFNLVSSPHFFFEIGIYCSLMLILWKAYVFKYVLLFVMVNQVFAGLITHEWYRQRFPARYPQERKAIIPYIL